MEDQTFDVAQMAASAAGGRLVPAVLAALVAAMVGAAVWAAVAILTDYELGILAWGIGLITGLAGAAVARQPSSAVGVGSAVAAAAGLVAAKVAIVLYVLSSFTAASMLSQDELSFYSAGYHLKQSNGYSQEVQRWLDDADAPYSDEDNERLEMQHQHEVEVALGKMSPEEMSRATEAVTAEVDAALGGMSTDPEAILGGLKDSFSPWDFLWFGLALFTAFRVGKSGLSA